MKEAVSPDPFAKLSKPAQRALANAGIKTLKELSKLTEKEFRALHGIDPGTIKPLMEQMAATGIKFNPKP